MPAPSIATFRGPSSVAESTTSTAFTITPSLAITGTFTPSDGGFGGTFTPTSLSWAAANNPQTFVYNAPARVGIATITPVYSGSPSVTSPQFLNISVTGANAPQHVYQFPQFAGVPPFQVLSSNNQLPAAFVPPPPVSYAQSISPMTGASPATGTLTYTLSATLTVDIHITPSGTTGSFSPTSVTIPAGSLTGTTAFSDSTVGVSTISSTNDQGLTNPVNVIFTVTGVVPPSAPTTYGTMEVGGGTVTLAANQSVTVAGPFNTPFREGMHEIVFASANGAFHLDYQYTPDAGVTWFQGLQTPAIPNSTDGTTNGYYSRMKIEVGMSWRIIILNTATGSINVVYERHLIKRAKQGR